MKMIAQEGKQGLVQTWRFRKAVTSQRRDILRKNWVGFFNLIA